MKRTACAVAVAGAILALAAPTSAGPATAVIATVSTNEFAPPTIVLPAGASLTFVQLDPLARHDLVSRAAVRGRPMFATGRTLGFAETMTVSGVEKLKPATYAFVCTIHDGMFGQLIVR